MAVYLIHFDRPYKHARHYIGYAEEVDKRMIRHRAGTGCNLIRVIQEAGIGWEVVRIWPEGDRTFERKLKERHRSADLCPCCRGTQQEGNHDTSIADDI